MNFNGFDFDDNTKMLLSELDGGGRLPHALIIESPDPQKAAKLAEYISMYAVCSGDDRPCGTCKNCINAQKRAHPDITYLELLPKKTVYTIEQMREITKDAYIKPNEARAKVYIFERADELFQTVTQNSFLKLSEEPPQDVFFILLCKNAQRMLNTILSRFTVISLRGEEQFDETELEAARKIAQGILENREYPLLLALNALTDKEAAPQQIISALKLSLRDALALLSGGDVIGDGETAKQLASRLTRKKIMDMIELCGSSLNKLKQNVNINLLTTWMCGEFRRITWQR